MKKYLLFSVFCLISSASFAARFPNCNLMVGANGKQYCYGHMALTNWYSAAAYCHKQGFRLATANDYCDAGKAPEERMVKNWGGGASCKNFPDAEGMTNFWLSSPVNTQGKMMAVRATYGAIDNVTILNGGFGAMCDMGTCETGTWNEERGVCDDGFCVYSYTAGTVGGGSDCSYTYSTGSVGDVQADCSYTYTETSTSASISSSQARGGCPANQYCALQWSDVDCKNGTSGANGTTIYGICTPKDDFYIMCVRSTVAASISSSQARGGCPADQYCAIQWSDADCQNGTNGNDAGTIYGTCTPKDDFYIMCLKDSSTPASVSKQKGCGTGEYCLLLYKNNTSCTHLGADQDTLYGVCLPYDEGDESAVCPIQ